MPGHARLQLVAALAGASLSLDSASSITCGVGKLGPGAVEPCPIVRRQSLRVHLSRTAPGGRFCISYGGGGAAAAIGVLLQTSMLLQVSFSVLAAGPLLPFLPSRSRFDRRRSTAEAEAARLQPAQPVSWRHVAAPERRGEVLEHGPDLGDLVGFDASVVTCQRCPVRREAPQPLLPPALTG